MTALTLEPIVRITGERIERANYFERFEDFPYDDWVPARQRYEFVNRYAVGDSLLDIGCGYYPISAEVKMRRKVGIDVSRKAAEKSEKDFDEFYFMDVSRVDKEILIERLGTFDTIVASELLEHLEDPSDVVGKISYLLNPNGKVLITVPNGNSIAGRVDKLMHNGEYEKYKVYHKTHVSLLSTDEWEDIFNDNGLDVKVFDFRPSFLIGEYPGETTLGWKGVCSVAPNLLAHQFFYVLRGKEGRE